VRRPNGVSAYFHRVLSEVGADPAANLPPLFWGMSNYGRFWWDSPALLFFVGPWRAVTVIF